MVIVQLEQLQGIHGEARKERPPSNHIPGDVVEVQGCIHQCVAQKDTAKE